jgi:hypothetical protein
MATGATGAGAVTTVRVTKSEDSTMATTTEDVVLAGAAGARAASVHSRATCAACLVAEASCVPSPGHSCHQHHSVHAILHLVVNPPVGSTAARFAPKRSGSAQVLDAEAPVIGRRYGVWVTRGVDRMGGEQFSQR